MQGNILTYFRPKRGNLSQLSVVSRGGQTESKLTTMSKLTTVTGYIRLKHMSQNHKQNTDCQVHSSRHSTVHSKHK